MAGDHWRRFYEERDYDRCIYREGETMIDYLETFFERFGVPETVLSVGCGPAALEFEMAERYPETAFTCVDVAEQVIEDNRALADDRDIDNISFAVGELPALDRGQQFDLVYCMATTYFVRDVETALRSLYDHVSPDGYLVADYPSDALREWVTEQDEQKQAFFELVAAGENIRMADEIESLFDEQVEDYGDAVGAEDTLQEAMYLRKR
jgi:SAM-dependent methyltransferase